MPEEARRARRGPKPKPDRGTPSGYRVSDRTRFELQMAALFVGTRTVQDTIDVAVSEFIERLRRNPGYQAALDAAESSQRVRAAVPTLKPSDDG